MVAVMLMQRLKAAIQQNVQAGVLQNNMKVMSDAVDWVTANQSAAPSQSSVSPGSSAAPGSSSEHLPQTASSTVIRIPGQRIQLQDADTSTPP